jgi:hypothetical protein
MMELAACPSAYHMSNMVCLAKSTLQSTSHATSGVKTMTMENQPTVRGA